MEPMWRRRAGGRGDPHGRRNTLFLRPPTWRESAQTRAGPDVLDFRNAMFIRRRIAARIRAVRSIRDRITGGHERTLYGTAREDLRFALRRASPFAARHAGFTSVSRLLSIMRARA